MLNKKMTKDEMQQEIYELKYLLVDIINECMDNAKGSQIIWLLSQNADYETIRDVLYR